MEELQTEGGRSMSTLMKSRDKILKGSSLLKFNPQALWRKTSSKKEASSNELFLVAPPLSTETKIEENEVSPAFVSRNKLIKSEALYFSEPEELRNCINRILPGQAFNLVLTDKAY